MQRVPIGLDLDNGNGLCVSRFRYEVFQTFVMDHESEDLIDFVLITEMGFFVLLLRLGLPS
jgi:hypothetical protein